MGNTEGAVHDRHVIDACVVGKRGGVYQGVFAGNVNIV